MHVGADMDTNRAIPCHITRADVITEARTWTGTRFQHGQWAKGLGCDCIGFVAGVAAALGLPEAVAWRADPRFRNYGPQPQPAMLQAACAEYLDPIERFDVRAGDVLLFAFISPALPMHFAFLSREYPDYMLHAYRPAGAVIENGIDAKWLHRLVGAFSLRGVG